MSAFLCLSFLSGCMKRPPREGEPFALLFREGYATLLATARYDVTYEWNPVYETNLPELFELPPIQQQKQAGEPVVDVPVFVGPYRLSTLRISQSPNSDILVPNRSKVAPNTALFLSMGIYPSTVWLYPRIGADQSSILSLPESAPVVSDFNFGALKGSEYPYDSPKFVDGLVGFPVGPLIYSFAFLNTLPLPQSFRLKLVFHFVTFRPVNNREALLTAVALGQDMFVGNFFSGAVSMPPIEGVVPLNPSVLEPIMVTEVSRV